MKYDQMTHVIDVYNVLQVLTKALQAYKGSIVVVTHNRNFCELLAPTHVAKVEGEPGTQTVFIEERNLRPTDWEGMGDELIPAVTRGTSTLSRKGTATASRKQEEEVVVREKFAWEDDGLTDSGLMINKQGKLVSKEKKLTPQQKKAEKMKNGGSSGSDRFSNDDDDDKEPTIIYRKGDKKPAKGKKK
jgi:hypothetical protein